jgi:hypothetical protein
VMMLIRARHGEWAIAASISRRRPIATSAWNQGRYRHRKRGWRN